MSDPSILTNLPLEQQAIRAKCFHPTGTFAEFTEEEIEQSIPDRFEKTACRYPDHLAVKTKDRALTYDELNRTANCLARTIIAESREGAEPIALLLDHNMSMVAATLGILKTGKIYVPLDPSSPEARAAYFLEDSQAKLIVTDSKNLSLARRLAQRKHQVINVDEIDANLSTDNLGLVISPDAFACILYTSGSTGQPKGVVHNHRNVIHNAMRYATGCGIHPEDRVTLLAALGTGQGTPTTFSALLSGAILYLFNIREDGVAALSTWLNTEEITVYISAPTLFRQFVGTLTGAERFPKLRMIRLGSEQIQKRDVELYKKHFVSSCTFAIFLSATETGNLCQYFIDKETEIASDIVPVGYPVDGVEILLFDDAGKEVGFNEVGEITVKSRYLFSGYWQNLHLSETTVLPDPKGGDKRIYRTGDLGRMLLDGCLEHLGRKDFQVKIRGHRVEITEIESALLKHHQIKETVVVAMENQAGDNQLVAYLVPANHPGPSTSELRSFLKEKLPDYMVPSVFMLLAALPLNPTGKVDRLALPDPGKSRPTLDTPFVAPRTAVEEELAQDWSEVLSIAQVGIHDNFFDLGGHSLAATRIVSQVIKKFQLELPLKTLFDSPTVAEMAAVIMQNQATQVTQKDLERLLSELEAMPAAEAGRKLASTRASRENPDAER